jgi:hypothetical protein
MISSQHVRLDALDRAAAKELNIELPNKPNDMQARWLDEMKDASGSDFDDIYVQRLRAAHGNIFPAIAVVRATTENDAVRKLAQSANAFVLTHLTLLESTGLVQYQELPKAAAPATGPIAAAEKRSAAGGLATPVIWMILATSLITGAVFTTLGRIDMTVCINGSISIASPRPRGGVGLRKKASSSPTSRSSPAVVRSLPSSVTPMATRFTVPNRLARQGMGLIVPSGMTGFSNSTAGPPFLSSRVWISVISSTVETGSDTRTSSPLASSWSMKSRRDL